MVSNLFAQENTKKAFSPNRFNFDIKLNEFPTCVSRDNIYRFSRPVDEQNSNLQIGLGCVDISNFDFFVNRMNGTLPKSFIPFAFEFSNRVSFATLGSENPFHNYVYLNNEFSLNSLVLRENAFSIKYSASIAFMNNIGITFPITSYEPEIHTFITSKNKAYANYSFILEFGLGVEYFATFGDYHYGESSFLHFTPTFSILADLSFVFLPNLELEGGLRVLPGWRLDIPIRMQYDIYETSNGVKIGITTNYDVWFLSGGLGLSVRY